MTDEELKDLVASVAIAQKITDKQLNETDKQLKESNRQANQRHKETDKQLKELGKQIGGLGRKFGSFTEGLALPSMEHILRARFHMETISPSVRVEKGGECYEIDVLAYANSSINEVYVVEVKSHLREEAITQLQNLMTHFRQLFPEHKNKKVYGILAAVDMSSALKKRVLSRGFYTANIKEDIFSLNIPEGFIAKAF